MFVGADHDHSLAHFFGLHGGDDGGGGAAVNDDVVFFGAGVGGRKQGGGSEGGDAGGVHEGKTHWDKGEASSAESGGWGFSFWGGFLRALPACERGEKG